MIRKTSLLDIKGNEQIKSLIRSSSLPHAITIEGPSGSGKHLLSYLICCSFLCIDKNEKKLPCLECEICRKILGDMSVDVIRIGRNGKTRIGVEEIRKIKQNLYYPPNDGDRKFYIIEEAHLMTPEAQNALLLSLESPPEFASFILLCNSTDSILETVISRSPVIKTELFTQEFVKDWLIKNCEGYTGEQYDLAAEFSDGALGKAEEILKNPSDTLKLKEKIDKFVDMLISDNRSSALVFVNSEFGTQRDEVADFLNHTKDGIMELIKLRAISSPDMSKHELSDKISNAKLARIYDLLNKAEYDISSNCSVRTVMTSLILNT